MKIDFPPLRLPRVSALLGAIALLTAATAVAEPASVTLVGSVQTPLGCTTADETACALTFDDTDNLWQGVFSLPEGQDSSGGR